jgi:methanogenic corrinoid protein MtbC1
MTAFVDEIAGPMTRLVGEYWARGDLPIYGEHLYTAVLDSLLVREASLSKGAVAQPTVLLTTPSGEFHTLGLSMLSAVLGEAGVSSLRLHGGLPVSEIAAATEAYELRAVGVSVTCFCPPKILAGFMRALRSALPADVALWFGGAGVDQVAQIPPDITLFASMYELSETCKSLNLSETNARQNVKAGQ